MTIVLQKYIAEAGLCSRRQAEELIRGGKVRVNGKVAELGARVTEEDEVLVNKEIIKKAKKIYLILNKPEGYVCTNRCFKGEDNVFDLIKMKERLYVVGRLDKNSCGLVLVTNDGDMTERITHPRYGHEKEYEVRIKNKELHSSSEYKEIKNNSKDLILNFEKGIDIGEGDGKVKAKKMEYLGDNKFKIVLTTGKKRQIRRMFKVLGLEIVDLIRTRIGSIELGKLKIGEWRYLKNEEISKLLKVNS